MPNSGEYYVEGFTGQEHALAKVEQVRASLQAIATGLNRLPGVRELHEDRVTAVTATGGPTNYTVTMTPAPEAYTDGMALNVRFPVANDPNPTLEILDADGMTFGAKPIRQVDGSALDSDHVSAHARAELYYVSQGSGYWVLGAGARGIRGLPGPPAGTFSVNASNELIFTPTGFGAPTNLGAIAPLFQGAYSSSTEYSFLDLVRSGAYLYLYINGTPTTGTAVTDTSYWQRYSDLPVDGGMVVEFRTATSQADPGNGRMRFNNSTLSSVTAIYLDDQDTNGNDLAAWVQSWDDYGADPNAQLVIKGTGGNTEAIIFNLTAVQDLAGYNNLTVTHVAGSTLPSNGDIVSVVPLLRGDTGATGQDLTVEAFSALTFAADLTWNVGTTPNGTITLTGNVTSLTLSGDVDGGVYNLLIKQDSTGGRTFALPSGWKWDGGSADTIASGANEETLLTIRKIDSDIIAAPLLRDVS